MKKIINNITFLGVILALLTVVGCESELLQEYDSVDVVAAPSLEFSLTNVQDSTLHVDYNLGAQEGWLFVAVVEGAEDAVETPTQDQMKFLTVEAAFKQSLKIDAQNAASEGEVLVTGLKQDTDYTVFVMPTSVDGVDGEIKKTSAKTSDIYDPVVIDITPGVSSTAAQEVDFSVEITFDEPVVINNADGFIFRYLNIVTFEYVDLPASEVSASGSVVTVTSPQDAIPGQYVFLSISDDAVQDRSANAYAGITSGLTDEGTLGGNYWRVAYTPAQADFDALTPTIGEAQQDPAFEISLTYEYTMDFKRNSSQAAVYDPADVVIRYTQGGTQTNVQVPAGNIAFDGNVVTITQPRTPVFGETVTLIINENAFRTRYNSPVAAITAEDEVSWLVSYGYTVDMIIGNYLIEEMVSNWDGLLDLTLDIEITAHAEDENVVLINNLLGSTTPIEAIFDGDFATLSIPGGQLLSPGTLSADVSVEVWNGYVADGTAVGFIESDGTILMEGLGFWLYDLVGENDGWWDLFPTSTWTPVAAEAKINSLPAVINVSDIKHRSPSKLITR